MSKNLIVITVVALTLVVALGRLLSKPIMLTRTYSREIDDRDGHLLRLTLSGDEKYRIWTPIDQISAEYVEAVLLHEDQHFFQHPGVNPWSLLKAGVKTYLRHTRRMGGSTITMQLARMISTFSSRSFSGKILQVTYAIELELFHSKKEILEAYLNLLPYGGNIEGIGAAARISFRKAPRDLTLAECLTLAVIPQSPNLRWSRHEDPLHEIAKLARARLFRNWIVKHPEDIDQKIALDLPMTASHIHELPFDAPHFVNLVLQKQPKSTFLETTLDHRLQKILEQKIRTYVESKKSIGVNNAMGMIIDSSSMDVLAQAGSADFANSEIDGQVNGTQSKRSPGSSLKPFVYALAMDQGLIHPATILKDTPLSFGAFDPENFDRNFAGPISATDALIRSRNIPAVSLASQLQKPNLYDFLKQNGIGQLREPDFYGLSLSLGGAEVSMEEILRLYAALANRGRYRNLRYFKNDPVEVGREILSPEASFLTLDMLRQNPRNDSALSEDWLRDSVPVAWKTGTSQGYRDAWTIGLVGPYLVAVWLGNFNGDSNPAFVGRELAAPLFFNLVDALKYQSTGHETWLSQDGLNIKKVNVCSLSGHLPGEHCPHQKETWFIPGRSPISTCKIHREIIIARKSGLRICDESRSLNDKNTQHVIYEFWPSDFLTLFKRAGLPRVSPPAFENSCTLSETQVVGVPPAITSPKDDVTYTIENQNENPISLQAITDGDVHRLDWFIGGEYVGQSEPQKNLLWTPRPGKFTIRVVDDLGRSDTRQLRVQVSTEKWNENEASP